ncbi:hypothetical protein BJY04DRAFT_219610 [Aspergillus karnatakaensis]|uniref:uncharacterized protein n=1 Tax=Aspergillus karnatakaensis TaxID=1810916 RepID=UPI003CCD2541
MSEAVLEALNFPDHILRGLTNILLQQVHTNLEYSIPCDGFGLRTVSSVKIKTVWHLMLACDKYEMTYKTGILDKWPIQ